MAVMVAEAKNFNNDNSSEFVVQFSHWPTITTISWLPPVFPNFLNTGHFALAMPFFYSFAILSRYYSRVLSYIVVVLAKYSHHTIYSLLYRLVACVDIIDAFFRSSQNLSFKQRVNNILVFLTNYNQWYQVMARNKTVSAKLSSTYHHI